MTLVPRFKGVHASALLVGLLFLTPSAHLQGPADPGARAAQENDIYVAVLRFIIKQMGKPPESLASDGEKRNGEKAISPLNFITCFISIRDKDPSNEFLSRLKDFPCKTKPVSGAIRNKCGVYDAETHRPALLLVTGDIHWLSPRAVKVKAGYNCGDLCGLSADFPARLVNRTWIVSQPKTLFAS